MEKLIRCGFYGAFVYYINQNQDQANVKTLHGRFKRLILITAIVDNALKIVC